MTEQQQQYPPFTFITHTHTHTHISVEKHAQARWIVKYSAGPTWEIDGETVETVSDFIFMGSKITADGDCSHEIKV